MKQGFVVHTFCVCVCYGGCAVVRADISPVCEVMAAPLRANTHPEQRTRLTWRLSLSHHSGMFEQKGPQNIFLNIHLFKVQSYRSVAELGR